MRHDCTCESDARRKNPRCPHRIDEDSARDYFKPQNKAKPCPVSGCSNQIKFADLTLDTKTQRDIQLTQRRQKQRKEKQDTEAIDEDD